MTPESGVISGESEHARAVAVSGLLAELGVESLELDGRTLGARVTDLPALLCAPSAGEKTVVAGSVDLFIVVTSSAARWRTSRPDTARAIRSGGASAA